MQVSGISSAAQVAATIGAKAASASTASSLDTTQFMQVLMTQLTHQDPLEPMGNAEMMSQFSQLNSLQELRDIHTAMDSSSASNQVAYLASLIGKTVKANRADGRITQGVVTGVNIDKDAPQIQIGTELFALTDIVEIRGESVLTDPIQVQLGQTSGAARQPATQTVSSKPGLGPAFAETLEAVQGVRFSTHAQKRLQSRDIEMNSENVNRLSDAIDKAEKRGGKSSLVMVDDVAFIVNVKDRMVVTALDANQRGEGVFTQIDSVVFADPASRTAKSSIDIKG